MMSHPYSGYGRGEQSVIILQCAFSNVPAARDDACHRRLGREIEMVNGRDSKRSLNGDSDHSRKKPRQISINSDRCKQWIYVRHGYFDIELNGKVLAASHFFFHPRISMQGLYRYNLQSDISELFRYKSFVSREVTYIDIKYHFQRGGLYRISFL
jgi:hypothetical protein